MVDLSGGILKIYIHIYQKYITLYPENIYLKMCQIKVEVSNTKKI